MEEEKIKLNIYQRINAVMQEVDYIQKSDKKVNGQYRFVSHDQVSAILHKPMTKHGIACIPTVLEQCESEGKTQKGESITKVFVKLQVDFINIDDPTDRFSVIFPGTGLDNSDKGIGKAISYAFKYALLKTFCLETGDDPDNDATTEYKNTEPKMTDAQVKVLDSSLGDNIELAEKVLGFLKRSGYNSFKDAPAKLFEKILKYITDNQKEPINV